MYLSPLSVKAKHAHVGSFTTCLGCPSGAKTWGEEPSSGFIALGRGTVDVRGVDKIFKFIATIPLCSTLYLYGTDKEIYAKQKVNNFRL